MTDLTRRRTCRIGSATVVGVLLAAGALGCSGSATSRSSSTTSTGPPATASTMSPPGSPATTAPSPPGNPTTTAPTTTASDDVEPPDLVVTRPENGATVTTRTLRVEGRTEPGAVVTAWNRWAAEVDADGHWSIVLALEPGDNLARIEAVDASGHRTEVEVRIRYRVEMSELVVGRWSGEVTVPQAWTPIDDFWVEFRSDGSYSAGSTGTSAFYYGTNDDYPEKVYSVSGRYPGRAPGTGTIAIVWAYDGEVGTVQQGSLQNMVFSDAGDRLEFDYWRTWAGLYGPIHYDLVRSADG
jgi:hypothetical protein